jgi:hypothetical protein
MYVNFIDPITAAAIVGTGIEAVKAISGTSDAAKRRLYEQNLAFLSADDKKKLDRLLIQANTDQAKQQILAQTLGQVGSARVQAIAQLEAEKEKTNKTLLIIAGISGILLLGGIVLILAKKK